MTERVHIGLFLEGVNDIPEPFRIFRAERSSEDDIRAAVESKEALIAYWREVRAKTHDCLTRMTDSDLKTIPDTGRLHDDDPNYNNPVREWFIMTLEHQNQHWGQLEIIRKLIEADRQ